MSTRARRELDQLYRGHRDAVYHSLLRDLRDPHEAEDVTQTAFLQAYGSVLRGRRPERPRAWLLTIADNLRRRRFQRSQGRPRHVPLDQVEVAAPETPSATELGAALGELPPQQRSALVLREVAGLSYEEIAHRLGVTVGSVQMLLFRARRSMRERLDVGARRVSSFVPGWLWNAFGHGDRLALPARAAGIAVALGVAALLTSGAPAAQDVPAARQPVAAPTARPEAAAEPSKPSATERESARTPEVAQAPSNPLAPTAPLASPEPAGSAGISPPSAPDLSIPVPEVPDVPALPAPPALPLPPLPLPLEVDPPQVPQLPGLP